MIKKIATMALCATSTLSAQIVYEGGTGAGEGKHLVFIASDHEYRAEETLPALARIMAKHHGFKCTVLFGTDEEGFIKPGESNIEGLEALETADGAIFFIRFLDLPDEQMKYIANYLDKGGPIVGLRTSSHGFKIPEGKAYSHFDFKSKAEGFEGGFGQTYLGNTWEGHYGRNHVQGTRIQIIPEKKEHVILRGVEDNAFCHAGGYEAVVRERMEPLTNSQPLTSMEPDGEADPKMPPMASTWTFSYAGKDGKMNRAFHSTQGASQDILDDNYRRMIVNGIFWSVGLEDSIKADGDVSFVGPYKPTTFFTGGGVQGVKPADLASYDSLIGSETPIERPKRKAKAKKKPAAQK
ncbi:hypothetical protein ACFPK9_03885 [Rubritalea spongiae]|uniref:ThuA-like domain-containing protein n=1 Tax=Rubritalea spongiae TaxID=430797 RepID=A0ABW5E6Z3_9BACT